MIMKKLLAVAAVVFASAPAFAFTTHQYKADCYIETPTHFIPDVCTVIDTREDNNGALRTRNIFSNRFGLTVKSWFDKRGFMTWDSHNKFEYSWQYKTGEIDGVRGYSYVMPGVLVKDVSWD